MHYSKSLKLFLILILLSTFSQAQVGNNFPAIKGTLLNEKTFNIPADVKGKYTLIGLAYSQKAEQDLQTWFQPVYTNFIEKPKPGLFNESYDINLYFIPMFTGVNQAAAEKTAKMLKQKLDKELVPYVLIYKGELDSYKQQLKLEQKDLPYFFLLDKTGKIVHATSGVYSEEKMEKITDWLDESE